ncbi:hypothetical protein CBR_g39371 [Chara braunii]|uniref:Uncharacterized protein n=1 Tax=Chara braunii TaxID=69332 RepID=A0A388LRF4_CHABU|nr:hypothetical protein CBR_g39371 [Chara braunii]|eukprot:GBG84910.1 hypothetical protein CBR_g39371 [Chara braunii]
MRVRCARGKSVGSFTERHMLYHQLGTVFSSSYRLRSLGPCYAEVVPSPTASYPLGGVALKFRSASYPLGGGTLKFRSIDRSNAGEYVLFERNGPKGYIFCREHIFCSCSLRPLLYLLLLFLVSCAPMADAYTFHSFG